MPLVRRSPRRRRTLRHRAKRRCAERPSPVVVCQGCAVRVQVRDVVDLGIQALLLLRWISAMLVLDLAEALREGDLLRVR